MENEIKNNIQQIISKEEMKQLEILAQYWRLSAQIEENRFKTIVLIKELEKQK